MLSFTRKSIKKKLIFSYVEVVGSSVTVVVSSSTCSSESEVVVVVTDVVVVDVLRKAVYEKTL